jgi:5-methylcytosine-specific restriction endonuclease McrA
MRYTKEQKAQIARRQRQRDVYYDMFGNITRIVYFCKICGRRRALDDLEVDHKIPASLGGPDTLDNLQLLCSKCNREKGNAIEIKGKLVRIKPRIVKKGSTSKRKSSTTRKKSGRVSRKSTTTRKKTTTVKRKTSTTKRKSSTIKKKRSTAKRKTSTLRTKRR